MSTAAAPERQRMSRALAKTGDKGIYKRGGRYVVIYRDMQGRQRKRAARTLSEARTLKAALTTDVKRGEYRATSRATFADYAAQWIGSYQGRTERGIGPRTLALYRADLGLDADNQVIVGKDGRPVGAIGYFGRMMLAEIGPAELKSYARQVADRGHARSTVRRSLAPVKALLATAHEDGLIRFNPAAGVRNLVPARQDEEIVERVKAFAPDELAAVLAAIPETWTPFFQLLAETGLRIGEAIEARWSDLDRGTRTLTVARQYHRGEVGLPKGRKTRRIPISSRMDAILWEHRKTTRAADGDLIFTARGGARLDQKNLAARVLKPALADAGVGEWVVVKADTRRAESWAGFHTFRHTAASMLFRNGWNAMQVSRFLGHSDAGFTLRTYVHLLDEDLPEPDVLDTVERGNTGATQPTETDRDAEDRNGGDLLEIGRILHVAEA